ncbi:MAG: sporulation protein YabP [Clostridia bacterium]|nr:sporulation protein YabP [Clostridia bacterium]
MNEQNKTNQNHGIILENRERLSISGVLDVIGFDDETVLMETELGQLTVKGQNLKVLSFTVEVGSISVEGTVSALVYTGTTKKGALKRLFG